MTKQCLWGLAGILWKNMLGIQGNIEANHVNQLWRIGCGRRSIM